MNNTPAGVSVKRWQVYLLIHGLMEIKNTIALIGWRRQKYQQDPSSKV